MGPRVVDATGQVTGSLQTSSSHPPKLCTLHDKKTFRTCDLSSIFVNNQKRLCGMSFLVCDELVCRDMCWKQWCGRFPTTHPVLVKLCPYILKFLSASWAAQSTMIGVFKFLPREVDLRESHSNVGEKAFQREHFSSSLC